VSKKSKKRKENKENIQLGKANTMQLVPSRKTTTLAAELEAVYAAENLSTVCCRQCTCCRVACPQMKFSEANNIIDTIWNKWDKADKKDLLVTSVKYYFSDSLIKPCPLLSGNTCRAYDIRPLNCRLYGLWPEDMWESRVEMFVKSTGLDRDKIPLNRQCPNVRRADGLPPMTRDQIEKRFRALDAMDAVLGISEAKIKSAWNYRTIHDWVLLKFWGEDVLVKWTNVILSSNKENRQDILEAFLNEVRKVEV